MSFGLGYGVACSPVREPSSMMRSLMVPRVRISPALAGMKLMGTVGVSMVRVELGVSDGG